jgi:hypothetical protein
MALEGVGFTLVFFPEEEKDAKGLEALLHKKATNTRNLLRLIDLTRGVSLCQRLDATGAA